MTPVTQGPTEELRDRLTRSYLAHTGEAPQAMQVRRFRRRWWDGATRTPSVVVVIDGARCRLVQHGGHVIALPASGWHARRAIRRLRRRASVDPQLLALAAKRPDLRLEDKPRVAVVRQRAGDLPLGRPSLPRRSRLDVPRVIVHIEQEQDFVRCSGPNCSALVQIPPPGRLSSAAAACAQCGRIELPAPHDLSERHAVIAT